MNAERRFFDDDEGSQPYTRERLPPERELITTPYDPPVKTLVSEIASKDLIVNPAFQRKAVWDQTRKSKLIESLLLNIPIPVCFFAEDDDGKKVVVDGQQRLRAIEEFVSGVYSLKGLQVLPELNRSRWTDLSQRQARIIENRTIRCIVISSKSDPNIRFEVFERLNTGGVALNDQELRNCVIRGSFNDFLNARTSDLNWLRVLGAKAPDQRMRHQELLLRFLTLRNRIGDFRPPLKALLNDFMRTNRHADQVALVQFDAAIASAVAAVEACFGDQAFRRVKKVRGVSKWDAAINRAVFDAQMLVLGSAAIGDLLPSAAAIRARFEVLCLESVEFSDSITKSTADRAKFYRRIRLFAQSLQELGIETPILGALPPEVAQP